MYRNQDLTNPFFKDPEPNFYQEVLPYFLNGFSFVMTVKDPRWTIALKEMQTFWQGKKNKKEPEFFQLSNYPPIGREAYRHIFQSESDRAYSDNKHWSNAAGAPPYVKWPDLHLAFSNIYLLDEKTKDTLQRKLHFSCGARNRDHRYLRYFLISEAFPLLRTTFFMVPLVAAQ